MKPAPYSCRWSWTHTRLEGPRLPLWFFSRHGILWPGRCVPGPGQVGAARGGSTAEESGSEEELGVQDEGRCNGTGGAGWGASGAGLCGGRGGAGSQQEAGGKMSTGPRPCGWPRSWRQVRQRQPPPGARGRDLSSSEGAGQALAIAPPLPTSPPAKASRLWSIQSPGPRVRPRPWAASSHPHPSRKNGLVWELHGHWLIWSIYAGII